MSDGLKKGDQKESSQFYLVFLFCCVGVKSGSSRTNERTNERTNLLSLFFSSLKCPRGKFNLEGSLCDSSIIIVVFKISYTLTLHDHQPRKSRTG